VAPQVPGVLLTVILEGQVTVGAWVSFTVTVKLQVAVPQALEAVRVMVVVPTLKKEPLPLPAPLPVVAPLKL
jgi:hypothetical protein